MKEEEERTPLRTILQNFLNHIEKLDNEKLEGSYDKEFQELKLFSELLKTSKQYSCSQGEKEVNRKKNRYKDILPFDCSRVILEDYAGIPGSDYINANYIKGASGSPAYIASQGPLPHTVNDFWRMVVQCEVQVIVMACNEEESGKHKCENYWVEHEGEEKQFGMVAIQLIKASVVCPDFLVRTMRLKYTKNHSSTQEERTVCQFHYSAWPDHGVPPLVRPLLDMVRLVRDTQASETLPVLVHCSAGCGRTGTICAIDYVWGLLRAGKLTKDFSLFKLVREMRKQRIAMVQTKEQYILVHRAVKELFNEQLRMIDSHPYENIDVNGMVKDSPEPLYATIKCDNKNDEKQDGNEKEDSVQEDDEAPPLPNKRKPYTAHTKQEKEVENLTEKQRSSGEQISLPSVSPVTVSSPSNSILQKPRIARLRALFERTALSRDSKSVQVKQRGTQQVTRSHSLGAVRKVDELIVQPIPNKGILRVPQLTTNSDTSSTRCSRPVLPIKRSKSLKVLSSGDHSKLSVPSLFMSTAPEHHNRTVFVGELSPPKACSVSHANCNAVVKDEAKPLILPKKTAKDKFSDRKLLSTPSATKINTHPPVQCVSRKNCEDTQVKNTSMPAVDSWKRRSLDSLPLENESIVLPSQNRITIVTSNARVSVPCRLNVEVPKVAQVCNDYLLAPTGGESEAACEETEKNVEDSHLQHLTVEAQRKVNAFVGGLGTRERRNSFRQAISKDTESNCKSPRRECVQINRNSCAPVCEKIVSVPPVANTKAHAEFPQSKMMHFPRKTVPYGPEKIRPRETVNVEQKCESKQFPSRSTEVPPPRVSSGIPIDGLACPTYMVHSDVSSYESRRPFHPERSVLNANGSQRTTEIMSVKGNGHSDNSLRTEPRPVAQNSFPHNVNSSHGFTRHSDSRKCSVETRPATSSVNTILPGSEVPDYKNLNLCMARRRNASRGPMCLPGASCVKQVNRLVSSGNEMSAERHHHSSQSSIVHQGKPRNIGKLGEQTSIIPEVTSVRCQRPVDSYLLDFKMNSKGLRTGNGDNAQNVDVTQCKSQPWERTEKSVIAGNPGISRKFEWCGRMASGVTSGGLSIPQLVQNKVQSPQAVVSEGNPSRSCERMDSEGQSRPLVGRPAYKLAVKLRRENTSLNEGPHHKQLLHGSQDDLALCSAGSGLSASSRVRRHASVVLLRHSLIEANDTPSLAPLAVWKGPQPGLADGNKNTLLPPTVNKEELEAWNGAPGVDVDMVAASIKTNRDYGTPFTRALEAFHLRKPSSRGSAMSPPQQRRFQQPPASTKKQHYL